MTEVQKELLLVLSELKDNLIKRFNYFGELQNKSVSHGFSSAASFYLGAMDSLNTTIDLVQDLENKYKNMR